VKKPGTSRKNISVLFWLWLALSFMAPKDLFAQPADKGPNQNDPCAMNSLPAGLQKKLASDFASWRVQKPSDLSPSANARWAAADFKDCPGIAAGNFRQKDKKSFAILLVPQEKPNTAYRLIIYSPGSETFQEEFAIVDKGDAAGASNLFLHESRISELFDETSRLKFHITAPDAVVVFDAGENEYEVQAYYWSDGVYRSSFVDM